MRRVLPLSGFIFGVLTVLAVLILTAGFDGQMNNQTIILVGIVISMFVN